MNLTSIIIDDEPQSQGILENYLSDFPEIKLLGTAHNVPKAYVLIKEQNPDLIFLDISMPGQNAFDLLELLPEKDFMIVFTTAHQEYAIRAFDARAMHYLLKPIDKDKLEEAVNRCLLEAKKNSLREIKEKKHLPLISSGIKLSIPQGDHHILLNAKKITRIEGAGSYSNIYTEEGKKHLVSKNIKAMEQLLEEYGFFRIHKSHIINLNFITEYNINNQGSLTLSDGTEVDISFRKKKEFTKRLKNHYSNNLH